MRVLDLAGGTGRHAVAALELGAEVTLLDRDADALVVARARARDAGFTLDARQADLVGDWPALGSFEAVLVFNYLDRSRMRDVQDALAPGGHLLMETFLDTQRREGWGPTDPAHLLRAGELASLARPLLVLHGREVLEPVDDSRRRALASILARKSTAVSPSR